MCCGVRYSCADEPRGDMLKHGDGTGRSVPNAACEMQTYKGGECTQQATESSDEKGQKEG